MTCVRDLTVFYSQLHISCFFSFLLPTCSLPRPVCCVHTCHALSHWQTQGDRPHARMTQCLGGVSVKHDSTAHVHCIVDVTCMPCVLELHQLLTASFLSAGVADHLYQCLHSRIALLCLDLRLMCHCFERHVRKTRHSLFSFWALLKVMTNRNVLPVFFFFSFFPHRASSLHILMILPFQRLLSLTKLISGSYVPHTTWKALE